MRVSLDVLRKKKGNEKIVSITAYDALFASIFDREVDFILVGDSLSQSFGGMQDTLSVDFDSMIYHAKAVCAGARVTPIVGDMSFGSYETEDMALKNAIRYYKQTDVQAIKLEGGSERLGTIKRLCSEGIAVMGHIGLMPQFVRADGGYKIKGRDVEGASKLKEDALALQDAGVFALVLEGIKSSVATEITSLLDIPTIGIGSGVGCDGQILVWSDAFGFFDKFKPKFVRHFLDGRKLIEQALRDYVGAVREGSFPNEDEQY